MRALSEAAARRCEEAQHPICACRCGGKLHGAKRLPIGAPRGLYERLPEGDPHKLKPGKTASESKAARRSTQRKRKPSSWVMGARAHLHYWAKKTRANDHLEEAYDLLFASRMILDCWNVGEPGLLVGMFYTPDWRYWRDVTAQPKPAPPGLPSAADLDRIAEEELVAKVTEKAEAT